MRLFSQYNEQEEKPHTRDKTFPGKPSENLQNYLGPRKNLRFMFFFHIETKSQLRKIKVILNEVNQTIKKY